jgi:Holliday junction resolvase-like predicted endonuclease
MAFLQRVTNGDGRIEREYAAGRGRMDLAVEYMGRWDVIEVKLRRKGQSIEKVKETGLQQILRYRNSFAPPLCSSADVPTRCYLVIFDRRPEAAQISWSDRLKWSNEGEVTVVEC